MAIIAESDPMSAPNIYYRTKKIFDDCSFTWTFENMSFFLLGEEPGYLIKSPLFPSDNSCESNVKWQLEMYPRGISVQFNDLVSLHLCLKSTPRFKIKIKCKLSFRDSSDNILEIMNLDGAFVQPEQRLYANLNRESLFKKLLTKDDIFKLKIEIISAVQDSDELMESTKPFGHGTPKFKLIEDLSLMFMQKQFCDVVVIVKGTEFKAHQNILSARSPVFAAMLQHDTKEKQLKRIEIIDIEPEIMQKLLAFIYTSTIEYTNTDMALKALIAADKYAVDDLKELSEEYLIVNTNTSNALAILNVADLHSAEELKSKTINFICSNRDSFTDVAKYEMARTESLQLLTEILANMAMSSGNKTQK